MNILYVLNSTYSLGGATKSFLSMLSGMMENGYTPIVVAPDEEGVAKTLRHMGVEVCAIPYRNNTYPDIRNKKDFFLFLPRLVARRILIQRAVNQACRLLKSKKIGLVHSNVSVIDIGERIAKRLGIPHVYHIREYADADFGLHYYPSSRAFHKRLAENYTICITKAIQRHHLLEGNQKSVVIYNGIENTPETEKLDTSSSGGHSQDTELPTTPYFLYAGRVEQAKGLMDLIVAFSQFAEKEDTDGISLVIAGKIDDTAYYKRITQYLASKSVKSKVRFLGARKDIKQLMRHAKATIVPSFFEGFGRCLPEAMLYGSITIGRNTAGTQEQYDNGLALTGEEIGYRFNTVEELEQCLRHVSTAPQQELEAMRQRALRTVNEYYTRQHYIESIISFYHRIESEGTN